MGLKEDVAAAAAGILEGAPDGLTLEALARQVAGRIGRQLPPRQVATVLQSIPQRFTLGGDGRWRLRERRDSLVDDGDNSEGHESAVALSHRVMRRLLLRQGYYV